MNRNKVLVLELYSESQNTCQRKMLARETGAIIAINY
jgi:hypothetical protein